MLALACLLLALLGSANKDVSVPDGNVTQEQESVFPAETAATETAIPMPWDEPGAKQPADYTWEEYDALTGAQQKAFKVHLGVEAYSKWLDNMRGTADVKPWDEPGAKQPEEYSWEEYEALSTVHQIAFQHYLGLDAFSAWLTGVQREATPWDESGSKQPADYTWKEFEALTAGQQMAFQSDLGAAGFEKWIDQVQSQSQANPWDRSGAKQPEKYTWKEIEALTAGQQMAFQEALGAEGFDEWLNQVQNQSAAKPWEKAGAKQPEKYTWKELEALTPAQQMAFQEALGNEGFEAWMNQAQTQDEVNPWDKSGAKQPEDYTWEEFEALTPAQQMAFQNDLGPDAFDTWLTKNEK